MTLLYKYLLIGVVILSVVGGIYYAGGVTPRRELVEYKAEVAAQTAAIEAKIKSDQEASDKLIKEKDHAYEIDTASIRSAWTKWMREHPSGGQAGKPVPVIAGVCNDQAGNQAVSDAVQKYVSAVGEFRTGIAGLLEQAEIDGASLQCAHDWAEGERLIHH